MDKAKIFRKVVETPVYLIDEWENRVMKVFTEGEKVCAFMKRKGGEPYKVDITNAFVFEVMNESDETTKEVYEQY